MMVKQGLSLAAWRGSDSIGLGYTIYKGRSSQSQLRPRGAHVSGSSCGAARQLLGWILLADLLSML